MIARMFAALTIWRVISVSRFVESTIWMRACSSLMTSFRSMIRISGKAPIWHRPRPLMGARRDPSLLTKPATIVPAFTTKCDPSGNLRAHPAIFLSNTVRAFGPCAANVFHGLTPWAEHFEQGDIYPIFITDLPPTPRSDHHDIARSAGPPRSRLLLPHLFRRAACLHLG